MVARVAAGGGSPRAAAGLAALLLIVACDASSPDPTDSIVVHPDLELTLFAREPDVVDPVALRFDAAGRMYVVEMRDYPVGGEDAARIRILEDTDGDGRADRSTVFADGLSFATSVEPWRGGVFVTAPPQILYLEDVDGDRRADRRRVVFDGFELGVTDSNVNGLRWALDNHIHGANGGNGGVVRTPGGESVPIGGLDFRFEPRSERFETTNATAYGFGLVFDDWGNSFSTYNIDHLQQRVAAARYFSRFPGMPAVDATHNISVHGGMARIFPISVPQTRPNHPEQAGFYSAAGGMGVLDFPPPLPRGIVVCDVVGNLVSREVLSRLGPIFSSRRAPEEAARELIAGRDPSFRPVGLEEGPDGAYYLIDMQRDVIEHPDYIPEATRRELDLRAGAARGRIYRLAPRAQPSQPVGALPARRSDAELVALLSHPRRWWRSTAQRLLIERDAGDAAELERIVRQSPMAQARLHALWTLAGRERLEPATIEAALDDAHEEVRRNALLLAEEALQAGPELISSLLARSRDSSPAVRFQAALSIGEIPGREAERLTALGDILAADSGWEWSRLAVMSSLSPGMEIDLLERLGTQDTSPAAADLLALAAARASSPRELSNVLRLAASPDGDADRLAVRFGAIGDGLQRAAAPPALGREGRLVVAAGTQTSNPRRLAAAWRLLRIAGGGEPPEARSILRRARLALADDARSEADRAAYAAVLAYGTFAAEAPALIEALAPRQPEAVRGAAWQALRQFPGAPLAERLLPAWDTLAPDLRPRILSALLRSPDQHGAVMAAIEAGTVSVTELGLDLEQRRALLRSPLPGVAERAAVWIRDEEYGNRKAVVADWLARLPERGDASRGAAVYRRACAQCHRAAGEGHAVGPDLESLTHRSREDLLSNILDPNMAVNPLYAAVTVGLDDGTRASGLVAEEGAATVTLVQAWGERREIARRRIVEMRVLSTSLMPEGLETGLAPADLADLIAWIQDLGGGASG